MSSSKDSMRKRISICGKKPSTAPTPAIIPSTTSPESHGATLMLSNQNNRFPLISFENSVALTQPDAQLPKVLIEM